MLRELIAERSNASGLGLSSYKLWDCQALELSSFEIVKLWDCQALGLLSFGIVKLQALV